MKNNDLQVLIVGAGPTGLTLACDLARRKIRFRLVDKASAFFVGSKGKGLQPRSLEVFDDLGIVEDLLRLGRFHLPIRAYDGYKLLVERDMHGGRHPTPATPYASPLIIPQWRVEETIRKLLRDVGGTVELATELVSLRQDGHGVVATLKRENSEEAIRCEYLVAADGGRSFVRKFLEVPFAGETWKDERMYVGDVRLRGLDREAWHSWPNHPDGWLALCPLPSTDTYQLQAQVPPGEEQEPSLELYQRIVNERSGRTDIQLTDAPWLSLYRVNVRMASRFRIGRVFLAGDAAHVHSPAGGQGMNTGIQDAYNLGWKLESVCKGAPQSILDTYEEERLPVAANVLGISTKLYKQISGEGEESLRRDAVTLQLGISYKEMSLSEQSGGVRLKLSPGDRAPDAPGLNLEGLPRRLFDVFRGPQFTLLRLFPAGDAVNPVQTFSGISYVEVVAARSQDVPAISQQLVVDAFGHVMEAYGGGRGEYVLVRPDGYIGWIGNQETLSELETYLDRVVCRLDAKPT